MAPRSGQQRLSQIQKQWQRTALLGKLFWAAGIACVSTILLHYYSVSLWLAIPVFAVVFILLLLADRSWRVPMVSLATQLNRTYPTLEESTQLLLPNNPQLSLLQQLQQAKVNEQLEALAVRSPFRRSLVWSAVFLLMMVLTFIVASKFTANKNHTVNSVVENNSPFKKKETVLPSIDKINVTITPPAYTQLSQRMQEAFNMRVETGALVNWQLQVKGTPTSVSLLFNDGSVLPLQQSPTNQWAISKLIRQSGYYQVRIDNQLSELYLIEAVKDVPPVISIQSPSPSLTIPYEGAQRFSLQAKLSDDYGLKSSILYLTVASGQGEAVKFHDQTLPLSISHGSRTQTVQQALDCRTLHMQPGDELYLWLYASDLAGQETRSDVFIVSLQDTSGQMSMDGMLTGLDVKPEMFRSQRQIIIETEQLFRDRSKIAVAKFQEKSNDLGTDQKLLRLRYGKFLGEEFSSEIGGDYHDEDEHKNTEQKDEAASLMELYSHNHDNAEDASYFDPATKKQMKEMLNEMWNAELKLRTYLPKEALPYEYKALRLLKDIQQKSRVYVPKTTQKPTPLQLNKRLSGDISKVAAVSRQQTITANDQSLILRQSIGILEELKEAGVMNPSITSLLQAAYQQLSTKAASQPALYLGALSSFRKIINNTFRTSDIKAAQKGIQQMLSQPVAIPYSGKTGNSHLSAAYFDNLKKAGIK